MSRLSKLISENAPIHVDESVAFAKFANGFIAKSVLTTIIISYAISFLPQSILDNFLSFTGSIHPAFIARIENLQNFDGRSQYAYAATIASGAIILIPFMIILASAYLRTVVYPGLCRKITARTALVMLFQTLFAILLMYWFFVDPVTTLNQRYPGMARIFIWPFFPLIGSVGAVCAYLLLFCTIVGSLKFAASAAGYLKFSARKEPQNGRD